MHRVVNEAVEGQFLAPHFAFFQLAEGKSKEQPNTVLETSHPQPHCQHWQAYSAATGVTYFSHLAAGTMSDILEYSPLLFRAISPNQSLAQPGIRTMFSLQVFQEVSTSTALRENKKKKATLVPCFTFTLASISNNMKITIMHYTMILPFVPYV